MVVIEPLAVRHAGEMYPLLADAAVWQFTDGAMPESLAALGARYARLEARESPCGGERWLNWIVRGSATGEALGFVQATIAKHSDTAVIAYVIGRRYWGRGFAGAAVRLMVAQLKTEFAIAHLAATVDARNAASIALLQRLGMRRAQARAPGECFYCGPVAA